jgi:hypothetical protein
MSKGFMNAELIAIRDNLVCGHCSCVFKGSDSQARKVKYERLTVYCSAACRFAAQRNRQCKPIPNRGPCPTCGETFFSRTAKVFCTLDCYVKSDRFREVSSAAREKYNSPEARAKLAATNRNGEFIPCLECGAEIYRKKSQAPGQSTRVKKFCSRVCYRSYLAKRFDRWVANPQGMALPQCYDEFLDQEELPCIVEGCDWRGVHLTTHANQAHGIQADDFKRAAGFNLTTGVVARPLAEILQQRPLRGVAARVEDLPIPAWELGRAVQASGNYVRYRSAECVEHAQKARALAGKGPTRTCAGCGVVFTQSTPYGRAMYCTPECRDAIYAEQRRMKAKVRMKDANGKFYWVDRENAPKNSPRA